MTGSPDGRASRSRAARVAAALAVACAEIVLITLGVWQLQRRAWRHDLIAEVDARVSAPAVPAPGPADWPTFDPARESYRHVRVRGSFLNSRTTLVQALTVHGGGAWVLTPLAMEGGGTVLVNRGFVPLDVADPARWSGGRDAPVTVTGLLRLSEPGGSFLRRNDPAHGRWFSRDVAAIAAAQGLSNVAPYFIDADATPNPGGLPIGGLTVVAFPDNHLIYAVTWFSLAALLAGGVFWGRRSENEPHDGAGFPTRR